MPRPHKAAGPRRIAVSKTGRVWWKPGEPHPLDCLEKELEYLREQLPAEIEALLSAAHQTETHLQTVQQLEQEENPTDIFTAADWLASRTVLERFQNRKHEHHLRTIFAIQRRRRLLGRLQAIRAALDLANGLLEEDETLSEEFLTTWRTKVEETMPTEDPDRAQEEGLLTREQRRLRHLDEPLTPIVGSVEQSRQLLRKFEEQLPELRTGLAAGQGWIEVFFVPKRHFTQRVKEYALAWAAFLEHNTPIPPTIEQAIDPRLAEIIREPSPRVLAKRIPPELRDLAYDIIYAGPYVKYRWREEGRIYTVSLGLLDDYPQYPFIPQGF